MKTLIKNCIRCKFCGDIIESRYTHEYKQCSCGRVAVDGGLEYIRRTGEPEDFEELSEYEDDDEPEEKQLRGEKYLETRYNKPFKEIEPWDYEDVPTGKPHGEEEW